MGEEELLELVGGEGDAASRERRRAHLERCDVCQEVLALLGSQTDENRGEPTEDSIGRFRVIRELGRGAMGTVYLARDPALDRNVALKVLRARDSRIEAAMRLEARALARLAHPNVVPVFEVGSFDDRVFMAMEHVEGRSLRAWLSSAPRTRKEILHTFRQAGEGLAAAHAAGIVHRDFKPDNVLVGDDGRVRVVDFGLARSEVVVSSPGDDGAGEAPPTETQETAGLVGTPAYMAPEQYEGRADARSDQFAFGVALAEALFGTRPFSGTNLASLREEIRRGVPTLPAGPRDPMRGLLERTLSRSPEHRYPSMSALLTALEVASAPKTGTSTLSRPAFVVVAIVVVAGLGGLARHRGVFDAAGSSSAPSPRAASEPPPSHEPEGSETSPSVARPHSSSGPPPEHEATSANRAEKRAPPKERSSPSALSPSAKMRSEVAKPAPSATLRLGANDTPLLP